MARRKPKLPDNIETYNQKKLQEERFSKVKKSNDLIQKFRTDADTTKYKLMMYLIAKAYTFDSKSEYVFDVQDFCNCCGIDRDNGGNYAHIKNAIKEMHGKVIWYPVYNDPDTDVTISFINKAWFNKRSGKIRIRIDEDLKPYILNLKANYTSFNLLYTLAMKSQYSIRLYELLKSWEGAYGGKRFWNIDELRTLLNCEHYTRYQDFRRFVLEPAQEEINRLSDLNITFNAEKNNSRSYNIINFTIELKNPVEKIKSEQNSITQLDGQINWWDVTNHEGDNNE